MSCSLPLCLPKYYDEEMRRESEHFGDQELVLVYIAKRMKEALAVEEVLNGGALDYAVEAEPYVSGLLFRSQRTGAFFYVLPESENAARSLLLQRGYTPCGP